VPAEVGETADVGEGERPGVAEAWGRLVWLACGAEEAVAAGKEGCVSAWVGAEVAVSAGKVGWVASGMTVSSSGVPLQPTSRLRRRMEYRMNLDIFLMRVPIIS
jgi:hypothetical protein